MTSVYPNPARGRGFALPMVVLLSVFGTLMLGALMMRSGGQRLAAQRDVDAYQQHHIQRGLQEVISSWLKTVQRLNLSDTIEAGSEALTMELSSNREISVWVYPAQWRVLGTLDGLQGAELEDARLVRDMAIKIAPKSEPDKYLRSVGPYALSLQDTPLELIAAVVEGLADSQAASEVADMVERLRSTSEELTLADFTREIVSTSVEPATRGRVNRLFTDKPTLWEIRVEVRVPPQPGYEPVTWARFAGTTTVANSTRGRSNQEFTFSPLGDFLEWREVDLGDPTWFVVGPDD
ncbi:MAG: hypothetical protein H6815_05725 [Phycisphaeraceae bacterium]|nr:hypothetical protein [Phycisphaerales bacterium]MCB9859937.1 hypothetical protein [Phycisphaeraceae bacterium]